jgi:transcription elongation factor Elf1
MEKADYFEHSDECPFCNKVNRLRFRKMHPTKKDIRMMKCGSCESFFYMKMKEEHCNKIYS